MEAKNQRFELRGHIQHRFLRFAAILLLGLSVASAADTMPVSEFTTTSIKKAKVLEDSSREKNPEIDHFKYLCPGLGGYEVLFEGADLRTWINLMINGRTIDLQSATQASCPGTFPAKANDAIEWRGVRKGDAFVPYAIIYRMESSANDDKQTRIETFVIIKLDGKNSKVVASIPAKEGEKKAEAVADKLRDQ
ncbi:MAG TPA: hypothetical protein VG733_02820 [Chthoniobacteraceae bacterium]|nr:hypothetical protein [Chthoniobacteraceae bacterium]